MKSNLRPNPIQKYPLCPVPFHNKHFSMLCIVQNEEVCCSCTICVDMECDYLSEQVCTEMPVCIFINLEYLALLVLTRNASPVSVLISHSNKIFLAWKYKLWCVKLSRKSCPPFVRLYKHLIVQHLPLSMYHAHHRRLLISYQAMLLGLHFANT